MAMRVLLVCAPGEAREQYQRELMRLSVDFDAVENLSTMPNELKQVLYHGVLLDIFTTIKSPREDKLIVQETLSQFPVIRLRWDPRLQSICALYFGQTSRHASLEDFVTTQCKGFTPRCVRTDRRAAIHFNVEVSRSGDFSAPGVERTVSLDVSRGGIFVVSSQPWLPGERASIIIKELSDHTPIKVEARRIIPWGEHMTIPGVGFSFVEITEAQANDICRRL
ncbi:MAG TPA: PilZ domain-containing protein [Candidatus Brocadiia bacterium]|nr:PilZ domain-containing protein [Candidatus Brocadiia bacterium]